VIIDVSIRSVPEPGAWILTLIGAMAMGGVLRIRRSQRPTLA
jgi:hypothetical protein